MSAMEVALIVVHRHVVVREFLVARRVPEGYWSLIGGLIEDGESAHDGARRELAEETGLTGPLGFDAIPTSLGYEDRRTGEWVTLRVFAAEAPARWEPVLDEEHDDYRWCAARDALELLFFAEPRQALREVAARLEEPS